ncbi:MAG: PAS domain S-box protein [Anaerolineae bacterium]|nr:PAS domain S-box protein [Anaerolineae bacterium]
MEKKNRRGGEAPQPPIYYVGIGASAGGLEALETFFTHMPPDSGMAFIIIQHLSPDYKSMMVELLSKRTEMRVQRAEEGMLVEPNCLYLIPPKKQLSIFHGKLLLSEIDHSRGINLPIDVFLRSLADDQAEKAVAIILSGTGSDGVRGIRAVKEAGGMVMVQSEESAKFDGMPRSAISTGLADFILPPEEMPEKLLSFARHPSAVKADLPQALLSDEDGMARIFALLRERTRVDFTFYKPSTVVRRIERRMTFNQANDLRDYVKYMETHPGEVMALYRELLIGVTSFFRDHEVFEELEEKHLPRLFERAERREMRFWVAGCSTGEEAYTLAILSREVMEKMGIHLDLKIFATDIDRDAIQRAGSGSYPESISADVPPRLLTRYFHRRDDHFHIDRSIREMVVFAQHNLVKDPPFTNIDLVSCRNLLIYLQPVLQYKVLDLLNFSLNPQGILLLGTSETTGELSDLFDPLHQKFKIYQSKGKRRPPGEVHEFPAAPEARAWQNRVRVGARPLRTQEEERMLERFLQTLAGDYVPLALVVNEQMEVLHILGDAEGYFRFPSGKMTSDVTKMAVKDLSIPLATGLQKAFKTGEEIKYTNIRLNWRDQVKAVQMRIRLLPGKKSQEPLAAVFIEEMATAPREASSSEVRVYDIGQEIEQRIHDLEQELQFTRENLQATIEELETSNEELQATNEELLASNEELQSTNEELQSVNEELHTVNTEYQSKIMELTELTNDLDNLMASTRIATLFLDENLEIRRFTPELKRIFKILEGDIGRPLSHITHTLVDVDLMEIIRRVEQSSVGQDIEVCTQEGDWYLLRVLPYFVGGMTASGVVLAFVDINLLKRTQDALAESATRLASLYRAAPVGIGRVVDRTLVEVNDRVCEMSGYRREELIGQSTRIFYPSPEEFTLADDLIYDQVRRFGVGTVETHWKRKDGSVFPVLLSLAPIDPEKPAEGFTFTALDITAHKQAQADAQRSEALYRQLFETMLEGVVYQDAEGKIFSANPSAERILGLTLDQMAGRTSMDPRWRAVREDGSDLPGEEHPAMVALHSGKPVEGLVMGVFNPRLNETRWIRVNSIPLFHPGEDKPYQVYSIFNDITEAYQLAKGVKAAIILRQEDHNG